EKEAAEAEGEQGSAAHFRLRRFVHKQAFAFVVVERNHLVRKIGDEQAGVATAVVIESVDAHSCARHAVFAERESRYYGLFGEGAVTIVAIELVGLGVVGEEQVGPAVVVVVEHGDAERFGSGLSESGFLRYVRKSYDSPFI